MIHECKIITLPTKKFSEVGYFIGTKQLVFNKSDKSNMARGEFHFLYLTTEDEIKPGDWITDRNEVYKAPNVDGFIGFRKIVATNDKSLLGIALTPENLLRRFVALNNSNKYSFDLAISIKQKDPKDLLCDRDKLVSYLFETDVQPEEVVYDNTVHHGDDM